MNRRAFYDRAAIELLWVRQYQRTLSVGYVDLDDFKELNDRFGHDSADALLRVVAGTIVKCVRETDVVARLGGDEFAILFPDTNSVRAKTLTTMRHRLRQAMDQHGWAVTFSIGVLTCSALSVTLDDIIREADRGMYNAKQMGKDATQGLPR